MPEAPSVPQHCRDAIRALHSDWDIEWRREKQRFAVVKRGWFKGKPQSLVLEVCQEPDGSFRPVDERLVRIVKRGAWIARNVQVDEQVRQSSDTQAKAEADAKRETRSDLEARRDELETRVRLAKWTGRKRRNG